MQGEESLFPVVPVLLDALRDRRVFVRRTALEALEKVRITAADKAVVPALVKAMRSGDALWLPAAEALENIVADGVPALLDALKQGNAATSSGYCAA
jgi:hypothetical protein